MTERSYRQYCALARALDVVGDRWSLLIVRNLILGPLRWSELVETLPGIAKNLLSARLARLEGDGIVEHAGEVYRLSAAGTELEAPLFALADWGERHFLGAPRPGETAHLRYFMTAIRRKLRAAGGGGAPHPEAGASAPTPWLQLVVDGEPYAVRLAPEATVEGGIRAAETTLRLSRSALVELLVAKTPWEAVLGEGVELDGDPALVRALIEAL